MCVYLRLSVRMFVYFFHSYMSARVYPFIFKHVLNMFGSSFFRIYQPSKQNASDGFLTQVYRYLSPFYRASYRYQMYRYLIASIFGFVSPILIISGDLQFEGCRSKAHH